MPRIIGVGTAAPPHSIEQSQARQFAGSLFCEASFDVDRLLPVFENANILNRRFCMSPDWFQHSHGLAEKNRAYVELGVELSVRATQDLLRKTEVRADQIGHIFFVSTTGVATPSLDAHLFNRLKLRPSILRTPIWGLGCAGGVAGAIRASDWLKAYPEELALVVALELCGLTFIRNDLSKSNFVATSLFSDGCGAILMAGDKNVASTADTLSIVASAAVTWEDTLNVMGWDVVEEGFRVVFSKSIPSLVQRAARPAILEFLDKCGFSVKDIRFFLSHPGGAKVIEAYQKALDLERGQIESMIDVLRNHGNMSSATFFFVLRHFLDSKPYRNGDMVFSTALGPGFSSEMMLLRCD